VVLLAGTPPESREKQIDFIHNYTDVLININFVSELYTLLDVKSHGLCTRV
jgi:hypothetical protein